MSERLRAFYGQIIAVAIALAIGAVIIVLVDESPIKVFMTLLRGAFGDQAKVAGTLLQTTPILICGIAACIGLRGGMFNVGIEGQLFLGGFAAAWVGFALPLSAGLHVVVGMAVAVLAGAAWVAIPAYFRARYNTNEVVSTILSNYVAVLLTSYFTIFLFKRPGGWSETPPILPTAYLPELFSFSRLNWGLVIGLALALFVAWFFRHTAKGYSVSMVGSAPKFAEYGGIDVKRQGFLVLLASGAVGGLAGGIETLGVHHRFMEGFAPGFGFDGLIAALLANGSPIGTIFTALFFGALRNGSLLLETDTNASREIITVIQALIILSVSAQVLMKRRGDSTAGERRWKF
ncbi:MULTISPECIES: ABC transporter permease [Phyllobacteriaceae]|jgi:general nucleoside transport system permease protein|uniref:ABC transporter permease n=1 Tax=Mesorhizobium hungaricum TaxID=1566387 RepID=A0A1C2EEG2_9HYPH|nr:MULTISPECIES: ABC transporter permease [Mesorhizobium]MBN9237760.1 ABC transporter permease [Mesorhizobium sp.]MDQ0327710.1 simple sugar transport system permease protein [Mesorhizobium sp. YL-MeA3-2017]OCX25317.1 ABC transporter permease [Mesorhizobium hungaricum]